MIIEKIRKNTKRNPETGCLEWQKCTSMGYGTLSVNGKNRGVHRIIYEILVGPIPKGLIVRHRCHNRRCVNIEHLILGTKADNRRDCIEAGREARGTKHGMSKLKEEDIPNRKSQHYSE